MKIFTKRKKRVLTGDDNEIDLFAYGAALVMVLIALLFLIYYIYRHIP